MPKTHNNLWPQIVNFESLYAGYRAAARNKRFRDSSLHYRLRLEENIINTINLLLWKQWQPAPFRQFYVHDPKKRLISAPAFRDRVVHHALVRVLESLFERKFIADSYACRKGKGTHAAKQRVAGFVAEAHRRHGDYYVLKADISSYFHSIDRSILLQILERTISDRDVLWLIRQIVFCDDDPCGIPIGALTSQLFANIYLDTLDHYVKDDLGIRMYARYMDDFVIIHPDKAYLQTVLAKIDAFVSGRLHLTLNPKTTIYKSGQSTCHSVDFCGYRIWPKHIKPRKRTVKAARKRFRRLADLYRRGIVEIDHIRASIASFVGYMRHCNGSVTLESVLSGAVFTRPEAKETL